MKVNDALQKGEEHLKRVYDCMNHEGQEQFFSVNKLIFPLVHRWSSGCEMDYILNNSNIFEGDFVSVCRQVVDLYRQIKNVCREDDVKQIKEPKKNSININ
ncbi:MAG TPA: hypothetical protein DIC60_04380 [Lachnospiraceae bacterium]|nr:hypothetical protein [Lachnospiraceae bacterium]